MLLDVSQKLRHNVQLTVEHHAEHDHVYRADDEVPISIQTQSDNRFAIFGTTLPPNERRKAYGRNDRQYDNESIGKPIIALAATQHELDRRDPSDQKQDANEIE